MAKIINAKKKFFGTDGIRGPISSKTSPDFILKLGWAAGEVFKKQGLDVKLTGNIGYPILSTKNIRQKTIFIIEASSYQLEYSKLFNSKFAAILNIAQDHLERHKNLNNYISAKFKIIKNQKKNYFAFINKFDTYSNNNIKKL